jgi:fluoroacetyl-CoA thioesterase
MASLMPSEVPLDVLTASLGKRAEFTGTVGLDDTAIALGSGDVPVLATPRLLAWIEQATCRVVDELLPQAWTTVGASVQLDHLAPSRIGDVVLCQAEVSAVEGRRITFSVSALTDAQLLATGTILRLAVQRARFN